MVILIKKEFDINIFNLILGMILNLIYVPGILLAKNEIMVYFLFIFVIMLTNIIVNNGQIVSENKNKIDFLMTSLPIVRKDIVKSKYVFYGMYSVLYNLSLFICISFMNQYSFFGLIGNLQNGLDPRIILYSLSICLIYFGIVRPLYYYLGEKSTIIGYIFFLFLFAIPKLIDFLTGSYKTEDILHINSWTLAVSTFITALIIYFVSLRLSISIYNKKEF